MKRSLFLILFLIASVVFVREVPSADTAARAPAVETGKTGAVATIGVILPLTGRHAAYGNNVLDAILMASAVLDRTNPAPLRILVRDSESRSETLPALVKDLAERGKVLLIMGPLGDGTEAARHALVNKVPVLVFTQQEGIGRENGYVLRDMLTVRSQIAALVDHAVSRRGMSRFAVLYPGDEAGREAAGMFREEAARRGARIVRERFYGRNQTDIGAEIRSLAGIEDSHGSEYSEPEGSVEMAAPRAVDFEALFLPDTLGRGRAAALQLAYHGVRGVRLLGLSSWNQPGRVRDDGGVLEGALFADTFCLNDPSRPVQDFIERYYEATGREPGSLEATAFDSASLVFRTILDGRPASGERLRDLLTAETAFRGVTGRLSFSTDGESRRDALVLKITQGQIVPAGK